MPDQPRPPQLAEGQTHATDWGARFTRTQGQLLAELPVITSVGLCNVCEVRCHDVVRVAGLTSHCVSFLDGGELRFAYSDRGELIELHCMGISVAVTQDGRVMAGMRGSPALPGFTE
ncbi:hypothetical protein [uncultured Azohydromonas sp.]|mgnify:CR=1 FL=1|jgi:hypothetical protein|uniref:hypothetical protein n=1 Tax=uncultured Azohydromonas sp. TaxID=487342 RepID=UPI00260A5D06|nr:hypothetical protein [uncultured Azohydromonas sp.]